MTAPQPEIPSDAAGVGRSHAVHFYERDEELAETVAAFIGNGLQAGEAAVIIATQAHRELFIRRLAALDIDVEAARFAGTLTILDAAGTLAKLMIGDMPDADLFKRVVGNLIESASTHGPQPAKVRAYGEMVDILWQAGNQRAAIALEEMWSDLADVLPFDLLCGYAMASFHDASLDDALSDVCDRHATLSVAPSTADGRATPAATANLAARTRVLVAEIAHQKQVDQVLRGSVRDLRRAQATERDRTARSQHVVDELKETIRINELFTGVLAHDLRAPLAAILTAAQLMRIREARETDGQNSKALTRVLTSAERMSRMIEQLLDFTRLRVGGGIAIEPKPADIAVLAKQAVDELEASYPDCSVQVTHAGDSKGTWDADRLSQLLSNLVANALQHGIPAAGIRVAVDGTAPDVVSVRVHNMGAIPAASIAHVFQPLTGGQRRRDRSRGLGLGLFITKRIAEAHAGAVEVSSSEGDGTTFTLSLPRFVRAADAQAVPVTRAMPAGDAGRTPMRESANLAALAHDQLREIESRFRLLVEAVKDYAIFMLDPSGRVVTWNAGAQRIKGWEAREIIGRHFSQFYDEAEIRAGKCERELEGAAREGRFEDEGWRVRKDGTKFWANVVITALRSERGELLGFAKVTRDLTERRRLEQEQLSLARAEEAIRLRDEFLSLAAHELRTPLTVLQLQLDTLNDRMDQSGQRVSTKIQRAAQSSERLASLVESLLDVSRIATGRFALEIREFDLVDSVNRVVEGLRPAADRARCALTVDAHGPITGAWDQLRLEQALTNLIANAIKYGAGKPVRVSARRDGGGVVLEVRDHGPGIPETELERIFRRFERVASIRNYGGLGLGLYFIQAIADAHGGSVTASNASDGGACFEIKLPVRTIVAPADLLPQPAEVN